MYFFFFKYVFMMKKIFSINIQTNRKGKLQITRFNLKNKFINLKIIIIIDTETTEATIFHFLFQ